MTKQTITFATRIDALETANQALLGTLEKFANVIAGLQTSVLSHDKWIIATNDLLADQWLETTVDPEATAAESYLNVAVDPQAFAADRFLNGDVTPKYSLPQLSPKSSSPVPSKGKGKAKTQAVAGHPCCGTGGNERHASNCVNREPRKGFDPQRTSNDPWQQAIITAAGHVVTNAKNKLFNTNIVPLCPNDARHYLTSAQHKAFKSARDEAGIKGRDAAIALTQYVQQ